MPGVIWVTASVNILAAEGHVAAEAVLRRGTSSRFGGMDRMWNSSM